jgi:hypothetical protein
MDVALRLRQGKALTDEATISAAPDHLRMSSALKLGDTYYLYCDYVRADDAHAPDTFSSNIHLFISTDLVNWTHYGPVIEQRPRGPDSFGCVNIDAVFHDGRVYLYYLGIAGPAQPRDVPGWLRGPQDNPHFLTSTIMVAESDNPAGPFNKRTVLLRCGEDGAWDSWKLVDPHVCRHVGKFLLYYKGFGSEPFTSRCIGLAASDSPRGPFTKHEDNPIISMPERGGVEVPVVFSHHGQLGMLLMTFEPRATLFLTSDDGVNWRANDEPFSQGDEFMDIGLIRDERGDLLPRYVQLNMTAGRPLDLSIRELKIEES